MKILHLSKKYPRAMGGDAIVVSNLEKYQRREHEIFIVTSNCSEIENKENLFKFGLRDTPQNLDNITIRRILSLILLFFWGFKYLEKIKPHIIHSHSADLGFFISFSARFYKIPVVNTCHGISFPYKQYGFIKRLAEKFFLKYAGFEKIMVLDKINMKQLKEADINNVVHIPNGIDAERFSKKVEKSGRFKFLFVGRIEEQKGLRYLIEAANLLKRFDFGILLVGQGAQEEYLKKVVKDLGMDNVKFLGRKGGDELVDLYLSSDAFVLPSVWEGFPLSILEAWAASLPVITTSVGGILDVCSEVNSLVVEPKNAKELAEAMAELLEDKELRMRLGKGGRELVRKEFSLERTAETISGVYRGVT